METFLLHDLATGQTIEITEFTQIRTLAARPLLLRPDESLADLTQLTETWATEFPGDGPAITALRHNLIRAHWNLLRAQSSVEEAALFLQLTPPALDAPQRLQYLNRQSAHADRHFNVHLQNLRAWRRETRVAETAKPRTPAPAAGPAPPKPEPPPTKPRVPTAFQGLTVDMQPDGTMQLEIGPSNATLLKHVYKLRDEGQPLQLTRQILFKQAIPKPCRWHFLGNMDWDKEWQSVSLTYTRDEYIALAEYEELHKPKYLIPLAPADEAKIRPMWHPLTTPPDPPADPLPEVFDYPLYTDQPDEA